MTSEVIADRTAAVSNFPVRVAPSRRKLRLFRMLLPGFCVTVSCRTLLLLAFDTAAVRLSKMPLLPHSIL